MEGQIESARARGIQVDVSDWRLCWDPRVILIVICRKSFSLEDLPARHLFGVT